MREDGESKLLTFLPQSLKVEVAAAGRKESVSQSLFVEVDEEDVSTMAALFVTEGVWTGRCRGGGGKAWRKHILEVQTWRQVRGLAGAVMCETGDLGIMCAQRHTLLFEVQVAVDMRVVLPAGRGEDVEQARMCIGEKWEAKHECELKEGVWLKPIQAILRRRTNELWTDKHRNVMRKLAVEGGWVQKRTYDFG